MTYTKSPDDYTSLDEIEHTRLRPETLLGDVSHSPRSAYLFDNGRIVTKKITSPSGLEQCFIEALSNAADNALDSRAVGIDPLRIEVNMSSHAVRVKNYGITMPVAKNAQGKWVIGENLGKMRTGGKFKKERGFCIGKNGFGAKLTNICSKTFRVVTVDCDRHLKYTQTWTNNMRNVDEPTIIETDETVGYTEITYKPDFEFFQITEGKFDDDSMKIYLAHCVMVSFCLRIPVIFNGKEYMCDNLKTYVQYFFENGIPQNHIYHNDTKNRVEYCIIDTPKEGFSLSFVNNVCTIDGGVHVNEFKRILLEHFLESIKNDETKITIQSLTKHITIFCSVYVEDPSFKSQTKTYLTKPIPTIVIPSRQLSSLKDWEMMKIIYRKMQVKHDEKNSRKCKKSNRMKTSKVDDANWAVRGIHLEETVAFGVEGNSAGTYPSWWIGYVPNRQGPNKYGIIYFKGKSLNAINADEQEIFKNPELAILRETIGLSEDVDYLTSTKGLRYGKFVVAVDADYDGLHILGLFIVYFCLKFPSFIKRGRLYHMLTPVARAFRGKEEIEFFSYVTLEEWKRTNDTSKYHIKFYKGLGSSCKEDIYKDYKNPRIQQLVMSDETIEKVKIAFKTCHNMERKRNFSTWLEKEILCRDPNANKYLIDHFIDNELPMYINVSIKRAIPDFYDGFKQVQRQSFYASEAEIKKRGVKIIQITAVVIKNGYEHGDMCVSAASTGMALDYAGMNNMPYYVGEGGFGSRQRGRKGTAHIRYVAVNHPKWKNYVYRKEDKCLLVNRSSSETDEKYEYERYYPILPMHIINGCRGVSGLVSTEIPPHNPIEITNWLLTRLDSNDHIPFEGKPWFNKYRGDVILMGQSYMTVGKFEVHKDSIVVYELPIGITNLAYKEFLQKLVDDDKLKRFDNNSSDEEAYFTLYGFKEEPTVDNLCLSKKHSYSNMTVISPRVSESKNIFCDYHIMIYHNINDFLEDFYLARLQIYTHRKAKLLEIYNIELINKLNLRRYIELVNANSIDIRNIQEDVLNNFCIENNIPIDIPEKTNSRSFTKQGYERVCKYVTQIENKISECEKQEPREMWKEELQEFLKIYL